ncbi:ATP-binding cassette domain-containing protein [Cohnella faecalis]|uniref:ABC transporter ATP-binding protein n=1 Tax=Cohnella faecalis TaxID=2315694 RepID=A0A398CSU2_9BACL|nr:ABC transporter ATP-binding protein [Cohnella faecalis]RIE05230.1 ABC transporter ATP-binding protein [Cohnella faecalis]
MNSLRRYFSFCQESFLLVWNKRKGYVIAGFILGICLSVQTLVTVRLSKAVIDSLTSGHAQAFYMLLVSLMLFRIVADCMYSWKDHLDRTMDRVVQLDVKSDFVDSLSKLDLLAKEHPAFMQRSSEWELASGKRAGVYQRLNAIVQNVVILLLNNVFLLATHWLVPLFVLSIAIARIAIDYKIVPKRLKLTSLSQKNIVETGYFYNLLTGGPHQKELTVMGVFPFMKAKWLAKANEASGFQGQMDSLSIRARYFSGTVSTLGTTAVMGIVGTQVFASSLTLGDYVAITMAIGLVEGSIVTIFQQFVHIYEDLKYVSGVSTSSDEHHLPANTSRSIAPFPSFRQIEVKNLSFTYPNSNKPALNNISFTIRQGEKWAILGDNAAGKSTLIKLLIGLYRPPNETVYYDGIKQEQLNMDELWKNTSVLFQDFKQYMLSVKENVSLGVAEELCREDRIKSMLGKVGLPNVLRMAKGIDTRLGWLSDDSINLSGGEWQRLVLARTWMKNADLVIFDEPTSALDPNSELELLQEMLNLAERKTLIVISHRVGIASKVDHILLMRNGQIIESGTHELLLKQRGAYFEMWEKQAEWYVGKSKEGMTG